jgi:NAD(P)-dependent dehydrogenase (short-subunit alcohol dehydrogenase family)
VEVGPDTRVIVTGASRGIGRATAEAFAARGSTLGLVSRSKDELEDLGRRLSGRARDVHSLPADIADEQQITTAISDFVDRTGGLDVLVANADVPRATRLLGLAHGISPKLADRLVRRALGKTAAPAR